MNLKLIIIRLSTGIKSLGGLIGEYIMSKHNHYPPTSIWNISVNDKEVAAYEKLIAAAPDLFAACQSVEKWWLETGQHNFSGAPIGIFMLREAIEKAT